MAPLPSTLSALTPPKTTYCILLEKVRLRRLFHLCRQRYESAVNPVHKNKRQSRATRSLNRVPPTSSEAEALHSLFLEYGQNEGGDSPTAPDQERVWMGDTRLEKTLIMFPQERK